jgi:hypothetical protein
VAFLPEKSEHARRIWNTKHFTGGIFFEL